MRESENSVESTPDPSRNFFNSVVVGRFPLCTSVIASSPATEQSETESLRLGLGSSYVILLSAPEPAASMGCACSTCEPPVVEQRLCATALWPCSPSICPSLYTWDTSPVSLW